MSVQVHLRIRPFTENEAGLRDSSKPTITITAEDKVTVEPPEGSRSGERQGTYQFSKVHGPETRQDRFYLSVMKPIVDKAMQTGQNGLLFAYGTGRGTAPGPGGLGAVVLLSGR